LDVSKSLTYVIFHRLSIAKSFSNGILMILLALLNGRYFFIAHSNGRLSFWIPSKKRILSLALAG
jgi:hypothetical protein